MDYEVLYTKGTENKVADFLSRIESDTDSNVNDEVEHFERMVYHLPSPKPDLAQLIRKEQSKDQGIIFARDQVLRFGRVSKGRYSGQHLTMLDGFLRRNGKILVPQTGKSSVLTMTHNQAHPGVKRTTFLVKEKFTWDGISNDVRQFCRQCEICNKNKHRSGPKEPITPITLASLPRQVIAYDVATLPWGNGYRYFRQITDMFSKWIELVPMGNQTSQRIVEAVESAWVLRHGSPKLFSVTRGPTWMEPRYGMLCGSGESRNVGPLLTTRKETDNLNAESKLPNKRYDACSPKKSFRKSPGARHYRR